MPVLCVPRGRCGSEGALFWGNGRNAGPCIEKNTKKPEKKIQNGKKQVAILRITMYNSLAVA